MLSTIKTGLKCLLQGALMALAAVAYAGDEQMSDEVLLNAAQLRTLSSKGSLFDSSASILNVKAKPAAGLTMAPEMKLLDRLDLARKQLAADSAYAAQKRLDEAKGSPLRKITNASSGAMNANGSPIQRPPLTEPSAKSKWHSPGATGSPPLNSCIPASCCRTLTASMTVRSVAGPGTSR